MANRYIQRFQVPDGFCDILHDFASEVILVQPEDILDFAANYFEHKFVGKEYKCPARSNIGYERAVQISNERKKQQSQLLSQQSKSFNKEPKAQTISNNQNSLTSQKQQHNYQQNKHPNSTQRQIDQNKSNKINEDSHQLEKELMKEYVHKVYEFALEKVIYGSKEHKRQEEVEESQEEFEYEFQEQITQNNRQELERIGNREDVERFNKQMEEGLDE